MPRDWRQIPWSIPALALLLMGAGWLGIAQCDALAEADGGLARHQLIWSGLGLAAMALAAGPHYRFARRGAYWALAGIAAALLAVYLFAPINGAHRWIRVAGIGFQPSEFAKPIVVLALARYLMYRDNFRRWWGVLPPLAIAALPAWLVLKEPDLGTATVFAPVLLAMLWTAGARPRQLAGLALVGVLLLPVLWRQMSRDQRGRVTALWEHDSAERAPSPARYHLQRAREAFALGGFWGSWTNESAPPSPALLASADASNPPGTVPIYGVFGVNGDCTPLAATPIASLQPLGHVPEPSTDSIFCVIGEHYGIAGAILLVALYALLIGRGLSIAESTGEPFGRLVAVGMTTLLASQATINMGMLAGLLPITGVSLPLVSYGGSGLVANCLALGFLANVSRHPGYEMTADPFRWQ